VTLDADNHPTDGTITVLLYRVADLHCAIPGARVLEVMRGQPIDRLSGLPPFIAGLSIIRGTPVPVVDAGSLLNAAPTAGAYFVAVEVGDRPIALAVDQVVGLRRIARTGWVPLPPLLRNIAEDTVSAIRANDGDLLLLLDAARLVPVHRLVEWNAIGVPR
jgi:purine-binding chemotaxis protein CheW